MSALALSIVVTSRNDDYGGSYTDRILRPLQFNCERLLEQGIAFEAIVIEWDPVPGRPRLSELLAQELPVLPPGVLRRIVVAPEYQKAFTQNPRARYLEYVAKNVGIRRANGTFVLATNGDVMLGREVVATLAHRQLVPRVIYRAARYDIKLGIDQTGLTWDALEDPANQVRRPVLRPPLFNGGTGDFLLADRATYHWLRGFNEVYRAARSGIDLNLLVKAYGAGVPIVDIGGPVYHINHVGSMRISKSLYASATETPWGNVQWHSRSVVYSNPDGWGLASAPERSLPDGSTYLEFDWKAVPPLVELRRVVLPSRQPPLPARKESVESP
jgi:hypothetical protein